MERNDFLSNIYAEAGKWRFQKEVSRISVEDHGTSRGTRERISAVCIERTEAENARRKIRRSSRNEKEGRRILDGTCRASIHHGLTTGVAQAATTPSLRV